MTLEMGKPFGRYGRGGKCATACRYYAKSRSAPVPTRRSHGDRESFVLYHRSVSSWR